MNFVTDPYTSGNNVIYSLVLCNLNNNHRIESCERSLFKECSEVEKTEEVKENELARKNSKRDKSVSQK